MTTSGIWRAAVLLAWVCGGVHAADAPLTQLLSRASSSSGDWAHQEGSVLVRGDQPVCGFGLVQIGKGKPQYTYFVLFRNLPPTAGKCSVTGPLVSMNNDVDYQVIVEVGQRKIAIGHHLALDRAAGKLKIDDLKVGGTEIKPGAPRVFVVELSADPPTWKAIDKAPPPALELKSEDQLGTIQKIVAEYVGSSPELQAMLKTQP